MAEFTAWLHSDVGNLFARCSSPSPSQSPLLPSRASAGYQSWKTDDCWPSATCGVMDCALLWFVMRHNTAWFLFSIHTHTSECPHYWWIKNYYRYSNLVLRHQQLLTRVTTVALARNQSPKWRLHMLKLKQVQVGFPDPGYLIKGRFIPGTNHCWLFWMGYYHA